MLDKSGGHISKEIFKEEDALLKIECPAKRLISMTLEFVYFKSLVLKLS